MCAKCVVGVEHTAVNRIGETPALRKPIFQTETSSWNDVKHNGEGDRGESGR